VRSLKTASIRFASPSPFSVLRIASLYCHSVRPWDLRLAGSLVAVSRPLLSGHMTSVKFASFKVRQARRLLVNQECGLQVPHLQQDSAARGSVGSKPSLLRLPSPPCRLASCALQNASRCRENG
jgi:hypothetical protein